MNAYTDYFCLFQSISENLKQIEVDSNSPDPGTSESTLGYRQETAETYEQMEVDTVNISPTSKDSGVPEDRSKTDDNVQIKAGKSEVMHDV